MKHEKIIENITIKLHYTTVWNLISFLVNNNKNTISIKEYLTLHSAPVGVA